jgi:hypothetical protein
MTDEGVDEDIEIVDDEDFDDEDIDEESDESEDINQKVK